MSDERKNISEPFGEGRLDGYVELSNEQINARKSRSIAIGVVLFLMILAIYFVTYFKLGAAVF